MITHLNDLPDHLKIFFMEEADTLPKPTYDYDIMGLWWWAKEPNWGRIYGMEGLQWKNLNLPSYQI